MLAPSYVKWYINTTSNPLSNQINTPKPAYKKILESPAAECLPYSRPQEALSSVEQRRESQARSNQAGSKRGNKKGLGKKSVRDDSKDDEDKELSQLRGLGWQICPPLASKSQTIRPQKYIPQTVLPNRDPTPPTFKGSEM